MERLSSWYSTGFEFRLYWSCFEFSFGCMLIFGLSESIVWMIGSLGWSWMRSPHLFLRLLQSQELLDFPKILGISSWQLLFLNRWNYPCLQICWRWFALSSHSCCPCCCSRYFEAQECCGHSAWLAILGLLPQCDWRIRCTQGPMPIDHHKRQTRSSVEE